MSFIRLCFVYSSSFFFQTRFWLVYYRRMHHVWWPSFITRCHGLSIDWCWWVRVLCLEVRHILRNVPLTMLPSMREYNSPRPPSGKGTSETACAVTKNVIFEYPGAKPLHNPYSLVWALLPSSCKFALSQWRNVKLTFRDVAGKIWGHWMLIFNWPPPPSPPVVVVVVVTI